MTVRELIEELEEYPMDLPVVSVEKEIHNIRLVESMYYLDEIGYTSGTAVELE